MIKCFQCQDTGMHPRGGFPNYPGSEFCIFCDLGKRLVRDAAVKEYPNLHPEVALMNYRAGREIMDTSGHYI